MATQLCVTDNGVRVKNLNDSGTQVTWASITAAEVPHFFELPKEMVESLPRINGALSTIIDE